MTRATLTIRGEGHGLFACLEAGSPSYRFEGAIDPSGVQALFVRWATRGRTAGTEPLTPVELREFGKDLADLLSSDIRQALTWICSRTLESGTETSLELRLEGGLAQGLPWEVLSLPELRGSKDGFVAIYPRLRTHRSAGTTAPRAELPEVVRVLVAYANPATAAYPWLPGLDEEVTAIRAVLGQSRISTDVARLPNATPATLRRELVASPGPGRRVTHVLHFIGHGRASPTGGELILQGGRGEEPLDGAELAQWALEAGVQLVVLSACDTAGGPGRVAERLVESGVPAAIGMQYPVRDEAQSNFMADFYRDLLRGRTVDQALALTRVGRQFDRGWWIPCLVSSAPDQRLVNPGVFADREELPQNNLRPYPDKFIGRTSELSEVQRLLTGPGPTLVTIVGLGGIGKTRLAMEAASRLLPQFSDGCSMVDCLGLKSREQLVAAIVAAAGLQIDSDDPLHSLLEMLKGRNMLLFLDGFEGLVKTEAEEVLEAIAASTEVPVLVTSQVALKSPQQQVVHLGPMGVSSQATIEDDAIALFLDAATRSDRNFKLTNEGLSAVSEICQKLEGVPLALQVAAARTPYLSLPQLRDLVSLSEASFAGGLQRSIKLLPIRNRRVLSRLCVFEGGFSLRDASSVLDLEESKLRDHVVELCRHAMLRAERVGEDLRYRMLDAIRLNVGPPRSEELRRQDQDQHAMLFASRAAWLRGILRKNRAEATGALRRDMANFRAALDFCIENRQYARIVDLADALLLPFFEAGLWQDFEAVASAGAVACRELGDQHLSARMLGLEGALAARRKHDAECERLWRRRANLCREIGDLEGQADALIDLACRQFTAGNYEACGRLLDEAGPVVAVAGRRALVATVEVVRGRVASKLGRQVDAVRHAEEAERLTEADDDIDPLMFVFTNLGHIYSDSGMPDRALMAYFHALSTAFTGARRFHIHGALCGLAKVYRKEGKLEEAARCLVAADKLGMVIPSKRKDEIRAGLTEIRESLSGTAGIVIFAELATSSWEDIVDQELNRLNSATAGC